MSRQAGATCETQERAGNARRFVRPMAALAVIVCAGWMTRLPDASREEREAMARRFRFERSELPTVGTISGRKVRDVNPAMAHMAAWISSTGAAIALNDLDGDGLPNDVVYTDPRTGNVVVCPAPGSAPRYSAFSLMPGAGMFDGKKMTVMSVLPGDMNEDGLMDVLVNYWGRTPIAFLRKSGSGGFAPSLEGYATCEVVPGGGEWYTSTACLADLDGDTHVDLVVGNYFPDGCELLDGSSKKTAGMHASMSRAYNGGVNRVLRWAGATSGDAPSVKFEELAGVFDEEVSKAWTLAIGAADLDGDLLPELYFANDFGPDRLMHNRSQGGEIRFARLDGVKHLTTPNSKALGRDSFKGMGVDFGDLNGDGLLDMFVSNIAAEFALEESHFAWVSTGEVEKMKEGIAPYDDLSEELGLSRSGWGWETKLADFDNDGVLEAIQATGFFKGDGPNRWPELHEVALGNDRLVTKAAIWGNFGEGDELSGFERNPFYVRAGDGRFYDISEELGIGDPFVTRGIATGDVDGDGRLDFAIANQWEASYLFHSSGEKAGAFLGLRVLRPIGAGDGAPTKVMDGLKPVKGRTAVGTMVRAELPDGRKLVSQVEGGNGHAGARSPEVHFGLGAIGAGAKIGVELSWRGPGREVRRERLELTPGWHTVLLGASGAAGGN